MVHSRLTVQEEAEQNMKDFASMVKVKKSKSEKEDMKRSKSIKSRRTGDSQEFKSKLNGIKKLGMLQKGRTLVK